MAGTPTRERVRRHREELRKRGLRPVQIWVPDVTAPGFAEDARRQGSMVAHSDQHDEDQAYVDAITDLDSD